MELGDKIELRVLTGEIIGKTVVAEYNRIAFVHMKNILCTAIASSTIASYISRVGGNIKIFPIEDIENTVKKIKEYSPDLVAVFIGGSMEFENLRQTLGTLFSALASHEIDADFLIHLFTYVKVGLKPLQSDEIVNYLEDKRIITYTADYDAGLLQIKELVIGKDNIHEFIVDEYPVTLRHALLFNRGLIGRDIKFVKKE